MVCFLQVQQRQPPAVCRRTREEAVRVSGLDTPAFQGLSASVRSCRLGLHLEGGAHSFLWDCGARAWSGTGDHGRKIKPAHFDMSFC